MKIGITGDTHGDTYFAQIYKARKLGITHLIICGDFGYIWDGSHKEQKRLDYMNKIGIKILFIDGNHENFDILEKYPVTKMYGGRVQVIRDNIIHLMRGEIYEIDNKKIFTFGGGISIDKMYRKEYKSWWKQEEPSKEDIYNAYNNLEKYNWNVDYIITHSCHTTALLELNGEYKRDWITNFLNFLKGMIDYDMWFHGHMHENMRLKNDTMCLYKDVVVIDDIIRR